MNPLVELNKLLDASGRTRKWLAEQTGHAEKSVKQYLNGSKPSRPFLRKARAALLAEVRPPLRWDVLLETDEQFHRLERACRKVHADGLIEFCRDALLKRADEILGVPEVVRYPTGRSQKVAEKNPEE